MWELMELGLRCQRSAWEAQGRVSDLMGQAGRAGEAHAAMGEAMTRAMKANLRAWDRSLKLWSGK